MKLFKAVFFVIVAMISIQFGASFAKGLFPVAGPIGTTLIRISFAAIILLLAFRPWRHRLNRQDVKWLLAYGLCLGLMNLTFYIALEKIPLGIAVAIEFTGPLLLAILGSRKLIDYVWILLAVAGLVLLLPIQENLSQGIDLVGGAFALVAGMLWALYIFFGGKLGQKMPGTVASSYGMVIAALTVLPFGFVMQAQQGFTNTILLTGLVVALLSSAIPYSLEMFAMKKIPQKSFGILMSIEPVIATISGYLILSEVLLPAQLLAILFIVIASFGSVFRVGK